MNTFFITKFPYVIFLASAMLIFVQPSAGQPQLPVLFPPKVIGPMEPPSPPMAYQGLVSEHIVIGTLQDCFIAGEEAVYAVKVDTVLKGRKDTKYILFKDPPKQSSRHTYTYMELRKGRRWLLFLKNIKRDYAYYRLQLKKKYENAPYTVVAGRGFNRIPVYKRQGMDCVTLGDALSSELFWNESTDLITYEAPLSKVMEPLKEIARDSQKRFFQFLNWHERLSIKSSAKLTSREKYIISRRARRYLKAIKGSKYDMHSPKLIDIIEKIDREPRALDTQYFGCLHRIVTYMRLRQYKKANFYCEHFVTKLSK